MPPRPRLRSLRRPVAVVGAAIAVVALGAVAVSARADHGPSYRTATVGRHGVDQVLSTVGVVEPVSQASVAFPVAGTVSAVWVSVGDQVQVGDHLAILDTEELEDAVHEAQATLDQAEVDLQLALDGQVPSSSLSGAAGGGGGGFGRSAGASLASAIAAAQRDVLDAQEAVDEALAQADAALASAQAVCASSSAPADGAASATDEATSTTTTTPSDGTSDACAAALAASLAAQQAVADAQEELSSAVDRLAGLLDEAASGAGTTPTTTTTSPAGQGAGGAAGGTAGGAAPTGSGATGTPSSTGSTSATPSAADLVAYQKRVDAAAQALAVAEQAVAQATIVSPIDGTVVSVGLAKGDDATAGSSTQAIVVAGEGGYEVTTQVAVSDLPDLEVGQAAVVIPDGAKRRFAGEVVRIGVSGDDSGATTTYPVTISLTGDTSALGNGATASVEITTQAAREAVAVPTSAVTTNGTRSTVRVFADGKATTTRVEVGAVGRRWTEVTSGIAVGDVVVLADRDEPLPGSATQGSNGNGGQGSVRLDGGGFPGGAPPGGFPGGGRGGD